MAVKDYIRLMRPHQWYKNLLVFLAIVFVEIPSEWPWETLPAAYNFWNYPPLIVGFLVFCAVSSAGYILNDITDLEQDAVHPEKKERPLPSGRASSRSAKGLAVVLLAIGFTVAYLENGFFFIIVVTYFINSQLYNYLLRKWAIVDVVDIAFGFVLRAVAGTAILLVPFTSWLVIGVFFFALILGFGKRKNELQYLGEDAAKHKPVFTQYTEAILDQGITMSATWLVLFYALYTYNNFPGEMMVYQPVMMTVPIVAGLILRYVYLIQKGSPVGRKPHLAFKDKGILFGVVLFIIVLGVALFFWRGILETLLTMFPLFP
ncbi:MAG: UbiA prenyltransferase family protein [Candidatus Thorarchaeota archaeon]|nr:UbiA prenyltransferase family protein [Candidatus Thorarchaeota archaeon]